MSAVGEENSSLASKCMDFCQALAKQGKTFNFSLSIGSGFSFSLDTRSEDMKKTIGTKKPSPSTQRRNAMRRREFLEKKRNPSAVNHTAEVAAVQVAPQCDQCEYKAATQRGLTTHKRMKHGTTRLTTPPSPESLRGPGQLRPALNTSPILQDARREEVGEEKEEPVSPLQPSPSSPPSIPCVDGCCTGVVRKHPCYECFSASVFPCSAKCGFMGYPD